MEPATWPVVVVSAFTALGTIALAIITFLYLRETSKIVEASQSQAAAADRQVRATEQMVAEMSEQRKLDLKRRLLPVEIAISRTTAIFEIAKEHLEEDTSTPLALSTIEFVKSTLELLNHALDSSREIDGPLHVLLGKFQIVTREFVSECTRASEESDLPARIEKNKAIRKSALSAMDSAEEVKQRLSELSLGTSESTRERPA